MEVNTVVVGMLNENCYVLVNEAKDAIIIDPGDEINKILDVLDGVNVKEILVTHHHFDHVGALKGLEEKYGIKHNEFLKTMNYEIIKTPGHTDDSISFYFPFINSMFVGDFIFLNGIGRMDLGGNQMDMIKSIKYLLDNYNDDVVLYPGHGDKTTVGNEKEYLSSLI